MVGKRKHGAFEQSQQGDVVARPPAGTQTFTTGAAVRDALAQGSRQAFVAFHQQIITPRSALPLPITHATSTILQHYQSISPTFDEIFNFWRESDKSKNDRGVESAVALLVQIVNILSGLPFFRTAVVGIVQKLVAQNEPYPDLLNRLVQSGKRDHVLLGLQLAAAAIHTDLPDPTAPGYGSGRLALKVWSVLVEGGSAKVFGKVLGMRRRNKEGTVEYGSKDPLDKPDIRHAALNILIPLFPLSAFHAHGKTILPAIYNNMQSDPPVTIYRILAGLWSAIAGPSPGIARRTALALLDENALEKLLDLLGREDIDPTSEKSVGDLTMAFLESTTTVPGQGICFPDEGWYPRKSGDGDENDEDLNGSGRRRDENKMRKGLHNRILSNVVRKLGAKVVDGQGRVGDWVIKVLEACPEIVAGYWPHSALSLEPRLNARWLATISYVGRIISLPPPALSTFHEPIPRGSDLTESPPRPSPPSVNVMIESVFPSPLGKVHLTKGLQSTDHLVQHVTALALARGLQKLEIVQAILRQIETEVEAQPGTSDNASPSIWTKRRLELELECRRRVPEVFVIIAFAQKSATLARVPADSDDEPDPKLVAKSALLTEVALRLFGLYHKTLPTISREAKFDVGKLLVSASSAKAERRDKREAREGSVISDSGSVGSVGTIGTVGMGGGFGQSRGDVDGFEAISQVHVLSLLSQVQDWQWTNKASGSQYSYLYHILLLHLSTPHPITKQMTTNLLNKLLLPSILFEHDHGEVEIWLSGLPNLSTLKDPSQRAWLVVQQIHLLSFLDECVRRCMKTPYRYIEETLTLLPNYFDPTVRPDELVSPLFMTVLEQLRAKINGQLIATEAAGVILAYLGRVVVGMAGKFKDGKWLDEVVRRLEVMVTEAREKGQERKGLLGSVQEIRRLLTEIFGGDSPASTEDAAVKMVDEEVWAENSFERILIEHAEDEASLHRVMETSSAAAVERDGRLATHLLATSRDHKYLTVIRKAVETSTGLHADRLRQAVFATPSVKETLLPGSGADLAVLDAFVATVRDNDTAVAEVYVHDLLEAMRADKKGKNLPQILSFASPWTRFFGRKEAEDSVSIIAKNAKRFSESSDRVKETISALIVQTNEPRLALGKLDTFVGIGIVQPFVTLLRAASSERDGLQHLSTISIEQASIKRILDAENDDSYELVRTLAEVSPLALRTVATAISEHEEIVKRANILPIASTVLEVPDLLSPSVVDSIAQMAVAALSEVSTPAPIISAAQGVLMSAYQIDAALVSSKIGQIQLPSFTPALAGTAKALSKVSDAAAAVRHLVHLGLQNVTRFCSSDIKLDDSHLTTISDLDAAVRGVDEIQLDLDANLVEPVVTAIIQERLHYPQAASFAALLVEKSSLKASFIRQQMSLLFASPVYNSLASPVSSPTSPIRSPFIHLLSAMFTSNPYMTCQPNFIEQLLPLYKGSLSPSDQRILSLFQLFESYRHISVASVLSAWSSGLGRSSRPYEALTSLEPTRMLATAIAFPLRRSLRGVQPVEENDEGQGLYDPCFVLALFGATLATDLTGLDWVEILRTNVLGVAVMALSSRDAEMRNLGGFVLAKTVKSLESVAFQEKPQLAYILRLLRYSSPATSSTSQPRLPVIISTFLAHVLRTLASPSNPLYPAASRFLLQRHKFDAGDVPMLFGMLYASGEGHKRDRNWIVRFIRDASRSEADWRLLKRRKTVELLQTLYSSSVDAAFRRLVLQAVERITRLPPAALSLAHRSHLITWLDAQWAMSRLEKRNNRAVEEERARYLNILENLLVVLVHRDQDKEKRREEEGARREEEGGESAGKEGKGREWVMSAERVLRQAVEGADPERLETIARIALRLGQMPSSPSTSRILPVLVDRLVRVFPSPCDDQRYVRIVEDLFDVSLGLNHGDGKVRRAVEEIGWRVALLDSDVGRWVRKERRLALWESSQ